MTGPGGDDVNINMDLSGDLAEALRRVEQRIEGVEDHLDSAGRAADKAGRKITGAATSAATAMERARRQANGLDEQLDAVDKSARRVDRDLGGAGRAASTAAAGFEAARAASARAARALDETGDQAKQAGRALNDAGDEATKSGVKAAASALGWDKLWRSLDRNERLTRAWARTQGGLSWSRWTSAIDRHRMSWRALLDLDFASGQKRMKGFVKGISEAGKALGGFTPIKFLAMAQIGVQAVTALGHALSLLTAGAAQAAGGIASMLPGLAAFLPLIAAGGVAMWALKAAAKPLADELAHLKGRFSEVGNQVAQGGLRKGVVALDKDLAGLSKTVNTSMRGVGGALGQSARDLGAYAKRAETLSKVSALFDTLSKIISRAGATGSHILNILLNLLLAASPAALRLTGDIEGALSKLDAWFGRITNSGKAASVISSGYDKLRKTLKVITDFTVGLTNVLAIGARGAGWMGQAVADAAAKFRAWTESDLGVSKIEAWFAESKPFLQELFGLIGDVIKMFGRLGSGTDLTGLLQTIRGELLPALEPLLKEMNKGDVLGKIAELLGKVAKFASMIDVPTIGVFVGLLDGIVSSMIWLADNVPGVAQAFTLAAIAMAFWGPAAAAISATGTAIMVVQKAWLMVKAAMLLVKFLAPQTWAALAGPIGWVILAIGLVVLAVIWLYNNCEWFRNAVDTVIAAVKQFFIDLWTKVVEIAKGIGQAWTDAVKWITDAWNAVGTFFTDLWNNNIKPFFEGVWYWIKFIGAIIFTILVAPFVFAFNMLKEPVLAWWHGVIIPMVDGIVWLWGKLVEGTQWLAGKWGEFWAWIGQRFRDFYDTVIVPVVGFVIDKWNWFLDKLAYLKAVWDLAWSLIGYAFRQFYDAHVAPVVAFIGVKWDWLLEKLAYLKGIWDIAWAWIGGKFQAFYDTYINPVVGFIAAAWDRLLEKLSGVKATFDTIIAGIGKAWEGLKGLMAIPINWVIDHVINDAFVATWNWIAEKVNIEKAKTVDRIAGFATGGPIHGRGSGTSDSIIARVSNDEHVWTAAEVRAAGGHQQVKQMRQVALRGGRSAVQQFLRFGGESLSQFAQGGAISAAAGSAVQRGQEWAKSQAGKPYDWGAGGPSRYDCSGFQGAVWGLLTRGAPNFGHPFSTASFAGGKGAFGFVPGYSSAYTIGVSPPGGRTGATGHMAGNLGGMNMECRSGDGVVIGPRAAGPENSMFNYKFSLPEAGGMFVSGGAGGGGGGGVAAFTWEIAKAALDAILAPVFALLPKPPPALMGAPRGFAERGRDEIYKRAQEVLAALFGGGGGGMGTMGATSGDTAGIVKIICDVARGRFGGLARNASIIGTATGIVESHLQNLPGGDRDSVGVFQQRPSQGWGTIAQCMNVAYAAGSFFSRFPGGWASMDPGQVAQGVQRSAYPLKYGKVMNEAAALVGSFGGFDAGGMLPPGLSLAYNGTSTPEPVLTNAQWGALAPGVGGPSREDRLLSAIGELSATLAERPPALSVSGEETERAVYSALRTLEREREARGRYTYG